MNVYNKTALTDSVFTMVRTLLTL